MSSPKEIKNLKLIKIIKKLKNVLIFMPKHDFKNSLFMTLNIVFFS